VETLVSRAGLEYRDRFENMEATDFAIRSMPTIRSTGGFIAQNLAQGISLD
jgi:hypothetical protein